MVNNNTTNNNAAKSRNSNYNASRRGSNHKKQPAGNGSNATGSTQQGRAQNDHSAFPSQARPGVNASRWNTGNKQKGKQNNWTAPQNNQHKPQQSSPPVQTMQATPQQTSTALNPASIPFEPPKSGTVVELTDAELEIITKLESDNKELREQLSKMEAELMASQNDAIAFKLQEVSLLEQLETSKIETSATSEPSASTTSADSATNARVTALESDNKILRDQAIQTQAELSTARSTEQEAIKQKLEVETQVQTLQTELDDLKKSNEQQPPKAMRKASEAKSSSCVNPQKDSIIRRYQQRHIAGHTKNATSETEEMTSGQEKKATVYIRYRNPEEVAALEQQVQDAQANQKAAQDEVARLRATADVLRVDLDKNTTATTAEASTTNSEVNMEILRLRTEVDELKVKLNNTANSSTKEGEPNSDPSRTLLEGQLIFAKALLKSSENEKANSIAETIRLRKELTTYKQFEVDVSDTVLKGRKDFETLEAQLRKTKKQLRKYTGEVKKPKETTAGAVEETSKPKTKASHLLIQTTQLATLKEKDKQIEDIRLAAGWAHTKLTKTIVAQNDEIRKLKKNMKLPSPASKVLVAPSIASLSKPEQWAKPLEMVTGPTQSTSSIPEPDQNAHDGGTPIVYAQPAPHLLHIPRKDVQTTIDTEIAQSRQAFEDIRLKRASAFSSWQLEQAGQPHREKAWETLEKETFKEQQDLREELQVRKEALIRKARLAEDQLQTSLKLKKQQEAARIASEEKAKPVTVNWDASPSEALKESLAEARRGKQKMQPTVEETWGEARTTRGAFPPEAHKETLLGQQEEVAPTTSTEQAKPRTSASETMRRILAEEWQRHQKMQQPMVEGIPDEEL
ncbi:hypothetical protein D6C84_05802 [Aureobasidium pullulans]|uniref:Uncharacterized protein n=1 Tax=Aureobasidium pullulans TaxID=5580 RepID=A0A4S9XT33_AURPU|nr:hypothetical protein D6C84_05802 [Aureobasidium pullulans]